MWREGEGKRLCPREPPVLEKISRAKPLNMRREARLERDDFRMNRYRTLIYCLSMISAQTRSAFVARENRYPLFRIML
jgi:hypothetical protein